MAATWNPHQTMRCRHANRLFIPGPVPATATNQALIRVTRNTAGYSDVSDFPFTILGQPSITVTNPCQGYAQIAWSAIHFRDQL